MTDTTTRRKYALIARNARVYGSTRVYGNAFLQICPIGSRRAMLTATLTADGSIQIATGCFLGTLDEFRAAVETTHGDSQHGRDYRAAIALIESRSATWTPAAAEQAAA